jgi:Flp pilus assembly protein CpaB
MKTEHIFAEVDSELKRAKLKHPNWPTDKLHQMAIVNEEAGEATRATLHLIYEDGTPERVKTELVQTAAMCIRMLENLEL